MGRKNRLDLTPPDPYTPTPDVKVLREQGHTLAAIGILVGMSESGVSRALQRKSAGRRNQHRIFDSLDARGQENIRLILDRAVQFYVGLDPAARVFAVRRHFFNPSRKPSDDGLRSLAATIGVDVRDLAQINPDGIRFPYREEKISALRLSWDEQRSVLTVLRRAVDRHGGTALAKKMGVHVPEVFNLLGGQRRPGGLFAKKLADVLSVDPLLVRTNAVPEEAYLRLESKVAHNASLTEEDRERAIRGLQNARGSLSTKDLVHRLGLSYGHTYKLLCGEAVPGHKVLQAVTAYVAETASGT